MPVWQPSRAAGLARRLWRSPLAIPRNSKFPVKLSFFVAGTLFAIGFRAKLGRIAQSCLTAQCPRAQGRLERGVAGDVGSTRSAASVS